MFISYSFPFYKVDDYPKSIWSKLEYRIHQTSQLINAGGLALNGEKIESMFNFLFPNRKVMNFIH